MLRSKPAIIKKSTKHNPLQIMSIVIALTATYFLIAFTSHMIRCYKALPDVAPAIPTVTLQAPESALGPIPAASPEALGYLAFWSDVNANMERYGTPSKPMAKAMAPKVVRVIPTEPAPANLDSMTCVALRLLAGKMKIKGAARMTKAQAKAAILALS